MTLYFPFNIIFPFEMDVTLYFYLPNNACAKFERQKNSGYFVQVCHANLDAL